MMQDEDPAIARLWRGVSGETPGAMLDARILQAARTQHLRRRWLPLVGAAMAACLVLALHGLQSRPMPQATLPDTSTFGLYEGRAGVSLAGTDALDRVALDQMTIRQLSGGPRYQSAGYTPIAP